MKFPILKLVLALIVLSVVSASHGNAQTPPSCSTPGNLVLTDSLSDTILPFHDIESISVAEPIYSDGSQKLVFTLKVESLTPELPVLSIPLGTWNVIFTNSGGTSRYVKMSTLLGNPTYEYGTVSSLLGIPIYTRQGSIQGTYSNNGKIVFNVDKSLIGNPAVGTVYSVAARTYVNTLGIGLVQADQSAAANYNVKGNAECNPFMAAQWGQLGDIPVKNDYFRNGIDDFAVYRPNTGMWFALDTTNGNTIAQPLGNGSFNDVPVPGNFDNDGVADYAVYRRSTGTWYIYQTETNTVRTVKFGVEEDIPLCADYDGDRVEDIAVFRPSTGTWHILNSLDSSVRSVQFGASEDKPQVGDYDGDRRADLAVFRPSNGSWYVLKSDTNSFYAVQFGMDGDRPVTGDYDGDGKTDVAVFRPENGAWYVLRTSDNQFSAFTWGLGTDIVAPGDYNGNGRTDYTVYRPSNGVWYCYMN